MTLALQILIHLGHDAEFLLDFLDLLLSSSCFFLDLEYFAANPDKVQFEGFVHVLRYIMDNKTLILKYYANINDAPVTYLLIQASIKTENQLMYFFNSS